MTVVSGIKRVTSPVVTTTDEAPINSGEKTAHPGNQWYIPADGMLSFLIKMKGNVGELQSNSDDDQIDLSDAELAQSIFNSMVPDRLRPLGLSLTDVTLPLALQIISPTLYPSSSKALRCIRRGQIYILDENSSSEYVGLAKTRIRPGMMIISQKEKKLQKGSDNSKLHLLYEDNYMALVLKPAKMLMHSHSQSLVALLPRILKLSPDGDNGFLTTPSLVHRLDVGTSGIVVVSKSKEASRKLSLQFEKHTIQKTYSAILNGLPSTDNDDGSWNLIEYDIDEKPAQTLWRLIKTYRSMHAENQTLTLVEFKPLQGRKHQLRKHSAFVLGTPIVGDKLYGNNVPSSSRFSVDDTIPEENRKKNKLTKQKGRLYLCSNGIEFVHPQKDVLPPFNGDEDVELEIPSSLSTISIVQSQDDNEQHNVIMKAKIDLPQYFHSFLKQEEKMMVRHETWMKENGIDSLSQKHEISKETSTT